MGQCISCCEDDCVKPSVNYNVLELTPSNPRWTRLNPLEDWQFGFTHENPVPYPIECCHWSNYYIRNSNEIFWNDPVFIASYNSEYIHDILTKREEFNPCLVVDGFPRDRNLVTVDQYKSIPAYGIENIWMYHGVREISLTMTLVNSKCTNKKHFIITKKVQIIPVLYVQNCYTVFTGVDANPCGVTREISSVTGVRCTPNPTLKCDPNTPPPPGPPQHINHTSSRIAKPDSFTAYVHWLKVFDEYPEEFFVDGDSSDEVSDVDDCLLNYYLENFNQYKDCVIYDPYIDINYIITPKENNFYTTFPNVPPYYGCYGGPCLKRFFLNNCNCLNAYELDCSIGYQSNFELTQNTSHRIHIPGESFYAKDPD